MKVAVTGATGFIGRHVLAELEARSVEIILLVRQKTKNLPLTRRCSVMQLDLHSAPPNAYDLMGRPDVLIHLAWSGLPNYKSLHHFEQELPAQYRFLKDMVSSGLKSLIVAGTCFEYGMQSGSLSEKTEPRPSNPYGFAKNALRVQLEYLKTNQPFHFTWARLFYIYGDGQSSGSLLPKLREAVERGDKLFQMSGGEQLRDYLPANDVAKNLVILALEKKDSGIVNICSGVPISVRSLVERWINENDWSIVPKLGCFPYPDYEPMAFWGDATKLSKIIGTDHVK